MKTPRDFSLEEIRAWIVRKRMAARKRWLEHVWKTGRVSSLASGSSVLDIPSPGAILDSQGERRREGHMDTARSTADCIRVLLVDDHPLVRQGLRMFIEMQDDMRVVGEGNNGAEAVELAARWQPDIVLLDLVMPGMDGIEAIHQILIRSPLSRVLILTSFGEDEKIFPAIRAGAQGYLLKDIQPRDLIQAIREMHQGKTQLHPDIAHRLLSAVAGNPPTAEVRAAPLSKDLEGLTEREREVLDLIARGLSNREIAEKMVISEKTVKTHVSNLLGRLGLEDRTRAAIWALKHGLGSKD